MKPYWPSSAADRRILVLAALCALIALCGLAWAIVQPEHVQRELLSRCQPLFLTVIFLTVLAATAWNARELWRTLALGRADLLILAGASLLSLALTAGVAPRTGRIFFDEQIYLGVAQNMSDLGRAQMCNDGQVEYGRLDCQRAEYNKQPYGFPYLVSIGFRLFGVHEWFGAALNNAATACMPVVVALTMLILGMPRESALLAATLQAAVPEAILWGNTSASEPTAALMAFCALAACAYWAKTKSVGAAMMAASITAAAAQFRPESILVLLLAPLVVLAIDRNEALGWRALLFSAVVALFSAGLALHVFVVRGESWGASGPRFSWAHLEHNLHANTLYYLDNRRFPLVIAGLAAIGVAKLLRSRGVVLLLHGLIFWGVFLFFYAGSYQYGADVRYALMSMPAVVSAAGVGAAWILGKVPERLGVRWRVAAWCAVLGIVIAGFLPLMRAEGEEAWQARRDVEFARTVSAKLPRNSVVLTHNPAMFHVWGVAATQMHIAVTEPTYVAGILTRRFAGGVFLHWNYWCNTVDDPAVELCDAARAGFSWREVVSLSEREFRVALLELEPSEASRRTSP